MKVVEDSLISENYLEGGEMWIHLE